MAISLMSIVGNAPVDQRYLPVCIGTDITLVSDYDDRASLGIQLGEQFQD